MKKRRIFFLSKIIQSFIELISKKKGELRASLISSKNFSSSGTLDVSTKSSGKIYVNGKLFSEYFSNDNHKMQIIRPFELINQATDYDVRCSVKGGGPTGQAGAMVHGISKALVLFDENFKSTLKSEKLTTRDSRAVERKKPGRKKARRSFQFSKR